MKNRVRALRTERDWSQEELAQRLGVSRQTIHAIEREKYDPSLPLALAMGRLFRQSVEQIFDSAAQPDRDGVSSAAKGRAGLKPAPTAEAPR